MIAASVYEEGTAYRRLALDDALVAKLKKTHAVWLENGLLTGAIDFNAHVLRDNRA